MKKVLILGAGGQIAQFAEAELAGKADLTLFLRHPEKLSEPVGTVITGDVFDTDQLTAAMKGQDIVYSNLGPQPMAKMAKAVIAAAEKAGVQRLIWVATVGIYREEPAEHVAEVEAIYGAADDPTSYFGDERVGADLIEASSLTSTIIRPNTLTNGTAVEEVVVNGRHDTVSGQPIARRTVAHFISELVLNDDQYENESIAISTK